MRLGEVCGAVAGVGLHGQDPRGGRGDHEQPDRDRQGFTWSAGPVLSVNPHLRALRIAPAERGGLWQYVSVGGWAATEGQGQGLEFVISTPAETSRAVEILAMVVHDHRTGRPGLGHTLPIGGPWLPDHYAGAADLHPACGH